MGLKEYALKLKKELEENPCPEQAIRIANRIKSTTNNGAPLSAEEIDHIMCYIQFSGYNHVTGKAVLHESDNSEFLKLVAMVQKELEEAKK